MTVKLKSGVGEFYDWGVGGEAKFFILRGGGGRGRGVAALWTPNEWDLVLPTIREVLNIG